MPDLGGGGKRQQSGAGPDIEHKVACLQAGGSDDLGAQLAETGAVRQLFDMPDMVVPGFGSANLRTVPPADPAVRTPPAAGRVR
jgi:hypothetical protein